MAAKRAVNGMLLLDKPQGLSSNQALQKVKWLFQAKKAGHTGTLDPLATGVLPICFGEATKFSRFLLGSNKRYQVLAKLGERTDTLDSEGQVLEQHALPEQLSVDAIECVLAKFRGEIQQVPPMYSALKQNGVPLYRMARQGVEVSRQARTVHIEELKLLDFKKNQAGVTEALSLVVTCSKGTYIRSLVDDIGVALGCGAHVQMLRRLQVSDFAVEHAVDLAALQQRAEKQTAVAMDAELLSIDVMLNQLPRLALQAEMAYYMRTGRSIPLNETFEQGTYVRIADENQGFLGVAEVTADARLKPLRLVSSN